MSHHSLRRSTELARVIALALVTLMMAGACAADAGTNPPGAARAVADPSALDSDVDGSVTTEIDVPAEGRAVPTPTVGQQLVDLPYVADGHPRQVLDLIVPDAEGPVPLAVWIHGGSWRQGDKAVLEPLGVLRDRGYATAALNYRFADDGPDGPAVPIDDVSAALEFLHDNAPAFGIDPDRIAIVGHSAGGQLAMIVGLTTDVPIAAIVGAGTPGDLTVLASLTANPSTVEYYREIVTTYLGCDPIDCPERAAEFSPSTYASADAPPIMLQHGAADHIVPTGASVLLAEALRGAGAAVVEVDIRRNGGHEIDPDRRIPEFLDRYLGTPTDS